MTDEEKKEYKKNYYIQNKDKLININREWKAKNKDKVREYSKNYNKRHSHKIKEWGKQHRDSRLATYSKHYQKHKLDRQKNKIYAILYKGSKCTICDLSYNNENAAVFDFHHLDPYIKDTEISKLLNNVEFSETIKLELDKCTLVCSNCHRLIHNSKY